MITIWGHSATEAFLDGLYKLRICGVQETSRNGPVVTIPEHVHLRITHPQCRLITDPVRDANPFFHLFEFIWMMAGEHDVHWLKRFNKNIETYTNEGIMKAAYGHRWDGHWEFDQVEYVIDLLLKDPFSRQAVINMWCPETDTIPFHKDKACNIAIMFRKLNDRLDMTVINRSNDFVWGALGANVVHFTLLFELVSHFTGIPMGTYNVISNNMHAYLENEVYKKVKDFTYAVDVYDRIKPAPMGFGSSYGAFKRMCKAFTRGQKPEGKDFFELLANPMLDLWEHRDLNMPNEIYHVDWSIACREWISRRVTSSSATSTGR